VGCVSSVYDCLHENRDVGVTIDARLFGLAIGGGVIDILSS
jgi:hypothetical protein